MVHLILTINLDFWTLYLLFLQKKLYNIIKILKIYIETSMGIFIIYIDLIRSLFCVHYINFNVSLLIKIINFNNI
jgi:hypothetical protein